MNEHNIITVDLAGKPYEVVVGADILQDALRWVRPFLPRQQTVIITDDTVARLHLPALSAALDAGSVTYRTLQLPAGEQTKTMAVLQQVLDFLIEAKIERSDAILAFGGGVIGDLVGFAASILRRGCNFIQIPTTLLAQVDSSVGGKTAVNVPQGKNLVGAFHQPRLVLADTAVLNTLPRREVLAGYAEVVKYGLINDPAFFEWCTQNGKALIAGDMAARRHAVEKSVQAKASIVMQDETETLGIRALLNLGHTFGHALEAETGYGDSLLHGEAVAVGMVLAFQFSALRGLCPPEQAHRVEQHFADLGMKTSLAEITNAPGERLVAHMLQDKKRQSGTLPFLLARGIGQTYLDKTVNLADIEAFLDKASVTASAAAE